MNDKIHVLFILPTKDIQKFTFGRVNRGGASGLMAAAPFPFLLKTIDRMGGSWPTVVLSTDYFAKPVFTLNC